MKRHARRSVNIRKTAASFFLAFVFFISLSTVISAEERIEITAYPGQTIRNCRLYFENTGNMISFGMYAIVSGPAADWVSPRRLDFGFVLAKSKVTKTYTIEVPEDVIVGQEYALTWNYYLGTSHEGSVAITIRITSQPSIQPGIGIFRAHGQLELLLWLIVPLLTGFFVGILINRGKLAGLLAGAIGAVVVSLVAVQIIYSLGYVVVVTDPSVGWSGELTAYEAFVDTILGAIILGAISGAVGGWHGKRARRKPVTQKPEILFFCPQCGRRLSLHDVDKFCPYCGKPLGEHADVHRGSRNELKSKEQKEIKRRAREI